MRLLRCLAILSIAALPAAVAAEDAAQRPTVEELQRQIEALRREIHELKRERAAPPAPAVPLASEPAAKPGRDDFKPNARLYGFLQSQFETTPAGEGQRFRMRRVRVGVRGDAAPDVSYRAQGDLVGAGGDILRDAYAEYTGWSASNIRLGQFKTPFSYEALESSSRIPTIERAFITEKVYHERDTGIGFFSPEDAERVVGWGAALMNGAGRNSFVTMARVLGAARLTLQNPKSRPLLGGQWILGLSTQQGHVSNLNKARPEDEAYGVDLTYLRGPWTFRAEWTRARQDALKPEGYYGLVVYRFDSRWEGLARFERYWEDGGPLGGSRATLGVNYSFSPSTRLMANYEFAGGTNPEGSGTGIRLRLQTIF